MVVLHRYVCLVDARDVQIIVHSVAVVCAYVYRVAQEYGGVHGEN